MFEFYHRIRRFLAHVLDRILIAEPVRTFDRVIHVPAPVILAHIAQRRTDTSLGSDRVTARREHLGDAGCLETCIGEPECCTQTGATGTDNDNVIAVIDELVITHTSDPICQMA